MPPARTRNHCGMREDEKSERMPIFLTYDLISPESGIQFPDTTLSARKKGRLKRMSPTCWADIFDMSATDTNVCRLGGVADRHKSRHCQPRYFGVLVTLWSQNDVITSLLRLTATSNCFLYQHLTYTTCFSTKMCC